MCGYTRLTINGNSNWEKVDLTTDGNFDNYSNTDGTYGVARKGLDEKTSPPFGVFISGIDCFSLNAFCLTLLYMASVHWKFV